MPVSRCMLLTAVLLPLATGCQSMVPQQTYRSQSPGMMGSMGAMPGPPTDPDGPTLVEELSEKFSEYFKPNPDAQLAKQKYQEADRLFRDKQYRDAADLYQEAADLQPKSLVAEDAMFMIGECHFFGDRYPDAVEAYQRLLKEYSNTRHLDRVTKRLFSIGQYWREHNQQTPHGLLTPNATDSTRPWFDTGGHALKVYQSVWLNDPTGPLADHAIMQTATAHFAKEDWSDADQFYTQLRNDYPNSKHIVQAFILGYRAKLNAYQGPGYDPGPLLQAEQLIETLLTQFSGQLGERIEMVKQARREVRAQRAEREWYIAELFYRKSQYRGATYYYQKVLKEYPEQQQFVQLATERLEEIADRPPVPPDRLEWFANLFPDRIEIPKPIDGSDAE